MSITWKWSLLLAAALVLGTALLVQAAPPFGRGGRGFVAGLLDGQPLFVRQCGLRVFRF